jgi:hypothetical protein
VQGEGTVARIRILIAILLLFSCITLITAGRVAFPAAHYNKRVEVSANPGPSAMILSFIHPNDPGSGGGGVGVHK